MANFNQYAAETFLNFQFFLGVVEARDDPLKLGRVRVRCYGIHSDSKSNIPTNKLPWAKPVMPYTSASISGIGASPTGPVAGTWVFGFFLDGKEMQQPMILGTLIGAPDELANPAYGFNDPEGIYPKIETEKIGIGESDVNKLARGDDIDEATTDNTETIRTGETTLAVKTRDITIDIPKAVPPKTPSVKDGVPSGHHPVVYFKRNYWHEPKPRYGDHVEYHSTGQFGLAGDPSPRYKSKYPLNHVQVTESGHIFEVDDSPRAGRIHQYHRSGTFYEIQNDGTRITKVVGDDYQIYLKDKNMVVSGNVSITVDQGDLRLYVHKGSIGLDGEGKGGDVYIECDGDYNLNVKGDMTTKIQGSEHKEVITDSSTQINGKQNLRVSKDRNVTVEGNNQFDVAQNNMGTVGGNRNFTIVGNESVQTGKKTLIKSKNDITLLTANNTNIKSTSNTNITTQSNFNVDATTKIDMDASGNVEITSQETVNIDAEDNVEITSQETVNIRGDHIHAQPVDFDEFLEHGTSNLIHHHDE